jgi:hypothetical protein
VLDPIRWNQIWGEKMTLLANGTATTYTGPLVKKTLGKLPRITACMVTIISTLDAFAATVTVKIIFKQLLLSLLKSTENGEDLLVSELNSRLNAWRSAGAVRELHFKAQTIRRTLIQSKSIQDGVVPIGEAQEIVRFLYWLLAENDDTFLTASSDIAGIAQCLSETGFDIVSVHGIFDEQLDTSCKVLFDSGTFLSTQRQPNFVLESLGGFRNPRTVVPIATPEESISAFPIEPAVANRCRQAWKTGKECAQYIKLQVHIPAQTDPPRSDVSFDIVDLGSPCARERSEVYTLATQQGFVPNSELCQGLEQVMAGEQQDTLAFLIQQLGPPLPRQFLFEPGKPLRIKSPGFIGDADFDDKVKINAFTAMQSFFMGYYYGVFLSESLVDTKSLKIRTVDGSWSFRSATLLKRMQRYVSESKNSKNLGRETLLMIMSSLLFSYDVDIDWAGRGQSCVGIVERRALFASSLVSPIVSPEDIGTFKLLDVDASGVPRDLRGLVRPGNAFGFLTYLDDSVLPRRVKERGPSEDFTKHIEADWDGDSQRLNICVRYKGRRLGTLNPVDADHLFLLVYVPPAEKPREGVVEEAIEWTAEDLSGCYTSIWQALHAICTLCYVSKPV